MKNLFVLLSFAFSSVALAGSVIIQPGETITIIPNIATTVTCGNGQSPNYCRDKAQMLNQRIMGCQSSNSTEWCLQSIWPDYKRSNASCLDEGIIVCLDACYPHQSREWCVTFCR